MKPTIDFRRFAPCPVWLLPLLLAATGGCSQIRLPAIDPSGEGIFLPPPNYTTLVAPEEGVCAAPRPVYPAAPSIPVCPQGGPRRPPKPAGSKSLLHGPRTPRGKKGKLIVTPGKISAPVGTEVVLLAGFCANDGFLMTDQPIQWHIAPGSVGHFVDMNSSPTAWLHHRTSELKTDYALSRTLCHAMLLTRGTRSKQDDVSVLRGQSWITVTSPVQGTTRVTVVAPNAVDWKERRRTSVILWIDAEWRFPAPTSARAGDPVTLVTRVTRQDGSPIRGWRVRYRVADGTKASFVESGQQVVEVPTDGAGEGRATLRQATPAPESTMVSIELMRPESDGANVVVGRGSTVVHWSASGLDVRASGPSQLTVGEAGTYRIELINPGDITARGVVATVTLPETLELVTSQPPAQLFGTSLQWNVGDLPARSSKVIAVTCRGRRSGEATWRVAAQSNDVARVETAVRTMVVDAPSRPSPAPRGTAAPVSPATPPADRQPPSGPTTDSPPPPSPGTPPLTVRLLGPDQIAVGEAAMFEAVVLNPDTTPRENVHVSILVDPAFKPVAASRGHVRHGELFEWTFERLAPGAERRVAVRAVAQTAKPQANTRLEVRVGDRPGGRSTVETVILGAASPTRPAPPGGLNLTVLDITDPVRVGDRTTYVVRLRNNAGVADQNVVVQFEVPPELTVENIEGPVREAQRSPDGRTITMQAVREIRPGETLQDFRIEVTARGPAGQTKLTVRARSARQPDGITAEQTTSIVME